ncbi:50S ribosomal protein L6 [Arenimonas oryziterrae]|uniref:Large ribosomal subunit protein uL6 n=1 Tax=Arenimonas oryziterrae DSM 21050 = YC6267 TaxID=1121015 RepID=A0A091B055_9GAMM|nr:50S ribosomal protein L6 [Arenimonas oryziterrae]KFN44284.1 50S ribosomal protein L6 [Arenimonas oryziterrae DSM 21050 = YC6267]
MSRVAKKPINLAKGVEIKDANGILTVKGPKGTLTLAKPAGVDLSVDNGVVQLGAANLDDMKMAGTVRAILANMITGVSEGFSRKLELVGVGYRAAMQGKDLSLSLGFSHPTVYVAPEGITLATPTQTEILVSGTDKQLVGEVAAKIRAYRKPEPYKGKGIRYSGEKIIMKEAKKA